MKTKTAIFVIIAVLAGVFYSASGQSKSSSASGKQKEKTEVKQSETKKASAKKKKPKTINSKEAIFPLQFPALAHKKEGHQIDFPHSVADANGGLYIAYLDHKNESDALRLLRKENGKNTLEELGTLVDSGILHPPGVAIDGAGDLWVVWPETHSESHTVDLYATKWTAEGEPEATNRVTLADTDASEAFIDVGTDSEGRVWVAWQSFRAGNADLFAKVYDPKRGAWSREIAIAESSAGEWEPRMSFDAEGHAWVIYDSSEGNEFNLNLARVSAEGERQSYPIAHSPRYEARASIIPTEEGDGFWIAGERGRVRWGLDVRGHSNDRGLNGNKEILFGRFDIKSGVFTELPIGSAAQAGDPVNLPVLGRDERGNVWLAYRYFRQAQWRIGITKYHVGDKKWTSRRRLENSSFGQDRRLQFVSSGRGAFHLLYPSDLRTFKAHEEAGVYLASLDMELKLPDATPYAPPPQQEKEESFALSQNTPERLGDDRHYWKVGEKRLGLYWGDLHRHTDVSNCRTGYDGCIVEHFRYAYDIAKLDFLGTSDHTDIGKIYHPYEWWHNQRMHDALHSPKKFNSLYVYEREQRWPWGHRNVVFAQRGGPVIYINRNTYRNSQWQKELPAKPGVGEINPSELWDLLNRYEKPVALISHTGATGMGTDWGMYENFDYSNEAIVEIFQGARVSYEGAGAPQPTAGHRPEDDYTVNGDKAATDPFDPPAPILEFGKFKAGTYQNALDLGLKLGVFASSDHISQHVSFGGVFCEDFTREGIIEAFNNRQTIAATDKIYLNFTCNDQMLGSTLKTKNDPELWLRVDGTHLLKRVTIVRNEEDWKVFENLESHQFEQRVSDPEMLPDVNRYYIRVEQKDGNMAWSSPIWVSRESE